MKNFIRLKLDGYLKGLIKGSVEEYIRTYKKDYKVGMDISKEDASIEEIQEIFEDMFCKIVKPLQLEINCIRQETDYTVIQYSIANKKGD